MDISENECVCVYCGEVDEPQNMVNTTGGAGMCSNCANRGMDE